MAHPKGALIERLQRRGSQPTFVTQMRGPDHEPTFDTEVTVDGEVLAVGEGANKRTAERVAAERALARLDAEAAPVRPTTSAGRGQARRRTKPGGAEASHDGPAATRATIATPATAPTPQAMDVQDIDEPFDGPWPMFETVLATCLQIAHDRIATGLATDDAREGIERFASTLYKNVLSDLGELVDEA